MILHGTVDSKLTIIESDQSNTAVLVAGLLDRNRRLHSRNILELHRWHRELQEKWTEEYEALAQSIARRIKEFHTGSSFAVLPDQLCSIVFSGISPMAARYRCCVIYLSIRNRPDKAGVGCDCRTVILAGAVVGNLADRRGRFDEFTKD
jgi:hypothetical protein